MKTRMFLVLSGMSMILLSGCGTPTPEEQNLANLTKAATEMAKVAESVQKVDPNNPQAVANSVEQIAAIGAEFEVQEFQKTESVDLPSNFPSDLVYKSGKVTSSSDNSSDEKNINQDIEIKTLDEITKLRDHYKAALATNGWKISSQSSTSGGSEYSASKEDGSEVTVSIDSNPYSKITSVRIDYSKYTN